MKHVGGLFTGSPSSGGAGLASLKESGIHLRELADGEDGVREYVSSVRLDHVFVSTSIAIPPPP